MRRYHKLARLWKSSTVTPSLDTYTSPKQSILDDFTAPGFNTEIFEDPISRRISEEINEQLEKDLAAGLSVGHQLEVDSVSSSPLSSFFDYPCARPGHANGHSNLPIRLLDTADMVKYLAEQRHMQSATRNQKGSLLSTTSDEVSDALPKQQIIKNTRKGHTIKFASQLIAACTLLPLLAFAIVQISFQIFAQATISQAFIEWQYLRFDQLTPDSFHFTAYGTLNNLNFVGTLHAAEYDMFDSQDLQGTIGKLSLPSIEFGRTRGTPFNLQQSIVIAQQKAPANLFHNIVNDTARFSLRGNADISWRKLSARAHLTSLPTFSASVFDHVHIHENNTYQLSSTADRQSIVFKSNVSVENTGSISLSLGQINYLLLEERGFNFTARSTNSTMHVGYNTWEIEARLPNHYTTSNISDNSTMLSSLLSNSPCPVQFIPISSTIDGQDLSYIAPLAQGLAGSLVFANPLARTDSFFNVNEMILVSLAQTRMTYDFSVTARVLLPYNIEYNLTGLHIRQLDIKTTKNQIVASMQSETVLRGVHLQYHIDGHDGSRLFDTTGPVALDLFDRPAWANALTLQEEGTSDSLMRVVGFYTAEVSTVAGSVLVNNLPFESTIHIRDAFNRTMLFGGHQIL